MQYNLINLLCIPQPILFNFLLQTHNILELLLMLPTPHSLLFLFLLLMRKVVKKLMLILLKFIYEHLKWWIELIA